jgi:pimeloyl-ACP methyl ester carboxylesterase
MSRQVGSWRRAGTLAGALIALVLTGCAVVRPGDIVQMRDDLRRELPNVVRFAALSAATYVRPEDEPSCQDAPVVRLAIPCFAVPVQGSGRSHRAIYLVEASGDRQVVSVRGTANRGDVLIDLGTRRAMDPRLEVTAHSGFQRVAQAIYADIRGNRRLDPSRPVILTGHSLGGAVALLVGLYLDTERSDQYRVERIYTFGQPKVFGNDATTAWPGFHRVVLRVVNCGDPVPIVPISQSRSGHIWRMEFFGGNRLEDYQHLGQSLVLMPGGRFWMPGTVDVERELPRSATNVLTDVISGRPHEHAMAEYIRRIAELSSPPAQEVPRRVSSAPSTLVCDAMARYLAGTGMPGTDGARAMPVQLDGRAPCGIPAVQTAARRETRAPLDL